MTAENFSTIPGTNTLKTNISYRFLINGPVILTLAILFLLALTSLTAVGAPPVFRVHYLGDGTPVAINNTNVVVGRRLTGSTYTPLVSENQQPWVTLPVIAGAMNTFPTDVNDAGVIVGISMDTSFNPVAVRWRKIKGVYTIDVLPRLPGHPSSWATGINNLGQVIGARGSLGFVPTGTGWLYNDGGAVVDLTTFNFWIYPVAINDNGIVIGGQERLNLTTGQVDVIGAGPPNYNPVTGVAINNQGMIAGTASQRSSSLNIVSLFRYEGATGWRYLTGTSRYTTATSINNLGDIGYGELGTGIYLDGLGIFAVGSLLDPIDTQLGWTITGSGALINDSRSVAAMGRNTITNQVGGVLLTTAGTLPTPTAPANLLGLSHPATRMEPFNSINLTWENTSTLTRGYTLQRRVLGTQDWTTLSLTPPGTMTNHTDTTVGVNITYEYRVAAFGLGGTSPWSPTIAVTSPATPLDTTPPVVSILSPANGTNVSGVVAITAQATDDVAIEYFEISFWNQFSGQEVVIGSTTQAGTFSVNWDTGLLAPATYRVRAFAYDTLGNFSSREVNLNVAGSNQNSLRVTNITLSTSGQTNITATGRVTVRDRNGRTVRGAWVTADWLLPDGRTETASAITNSTGNAFLTARSVRGTYTLTVRNVTKTGFVFDSAGSVLTRSITR